MYEFDRIRINNIARVYVHIVIAAAKINGSDFHKPVEQRGKFLDLSIGTVSFEHIAGDHYQIRMLLRCFVDELLIVLTELRPVEVAYQHNIYGNETCVVRAYLILRNMHFLILKSRKSGSDDNEDYQRSNGHKNNHANSLGYFPFFSLHM